MNRSGFLWIAFLGSDSRTRCWQLACCCLTVLSIGFEHQAAGGENILCDWLSAKQVAGCAVDDEGIHVDDQCVGDCYAPALTSELISGCGATDDCGDPLRLKDRWAESGITFQADFYQIYQGVMAGGVRQEFDYGGHGDYIATLDLNKLAGAEGLFLKVGAEHRFGVQGGPPDGAILPSAIPTSLPAATNDLILTNVLFTQFLSEEFAVSFGKLDTFDGDRNQFASGRGKTQFSNVGFVVNPVTFRTVPYSTLGVAFTYMKDLEPIFNFSVLNAVDTTTTDGFGQLFDQGVTLAAELRLPTDFGDRPGHQLFGATWSSREFASLGGDPRLIIAPVAFPQQSGSWSAYWNFDQYLVYQPETCTTAAHGWGLFGRAGIADDRTSPIEYFLSLGVGGASPIRGREADQFGIGWFQSGTSDALNPITAGALNLGLQGQGVELFYRIQVSEQLQITPDLQVIDPARNGIDTAYLAGVRALLSF